MSYRTRVRYLQKYGTIDYYTKEPELDICKNMAQLTTIQNNVCPKEPELDIRKNMAQSTTIQNKVMSMYVI